MEKSRRRRAMVRIPLVTFFAFSVFWAIWWFATGGDEPKDMVFHLSRAIDGVPAALLALVITAAFTSEAFERTRFGVAGAVAFATLVACLWGVLGGLGIGMLPGCLLAAILFVGILVLIAVIHAVIWAGDLAYNVGKTVAKAVFSRAFWSAIGDWLTGG